MISNIARIASLKYGRQICEEQIRVSLGLSPPPLEGEELAFVRGAYEVLGLLEGGTPRPAAVEVVESEEGESTPVVAAVVDLDDELHEFKSHDWFAKVAERSSDDLALLSEVNRVPDGDIRRWREWVCGAPGTFNSRRQRLSYVRKWSRDNKTVGLTPLDFDEASASLSALETSLKRGEVESTGIQSAAGKAKLLLDVRACIASPLSGSDISGYHIFGRLLPPRRTGDLTVFKIVDTPALGSDSSCNYFIKSNQTFVFNAYKNSDAYGVQVFTASEVEPLCVDSARFRAGLDWLNSRASGSDLLDRKSNPSFQFKALNKGLTVNCFRHYFETEISKTLDKARRALLNYWLCHSAATAEVFYRDS